jgi:hypothetical protein
MMFFPALDVKPQRGNAVVANTKRAVLLGKYGMVTKHYISLLGPLVKKGLSTKAIQAC